MLSENDSSFVAFPGDRERESFWPPVRISMSQEIFNKCPGNILGVMKETQEKPLSSGNPQDLDEDEILKPTRRTCVRLLSLCQSDIKMQLPGA